MLDVPDELASRLAAVPPEQVNRFAVAALQRLTAGPVPALSEVVSPVIRLVAPREGWNGEGTVAPNPAAIARAVEWSVTLAEEISANGFPWLTPHATVGVSGDVVLEWWRGEKKSTVFISSHNSEYLQSWGTDIENDMAEGFADSPDAGLSIWQWLTQA